MWPTAFLDVPAEVAEAESAFWQAVTAASRSTARGDHGEFWSLQADDGDPVLRVQRLTEGPARMHVERMPALGAHEVRRTAEWTTLHDPAGLPFCVTDRDPAAPWGA